MCGHRHGQLIGSDMGNGKWPRRLVRIAYDRTGSHLTCEFRK